MLGLVAMNNTTALYMSLHYTVDRNLLLIKVFKSIFKLEL